MIQRKHIAGKYLAHTSYLPGKYLAHTSYLPGKYLAHTSYIPGQYLAHTRYLPGKYLAHTSYIPGKYLAHTSYIPGKYLAHTSCISGKYLAHCYLITVFLTYACSFTSVWFIVLVSHENYVRIAQPQLVPTVCTPRRAATNISIVLLSAAVIYNVYLWTTEVTPGEDGSKLCMALSRYEKLLASINVLDLVLTLIIPVLLVSGLMLFTLVAVVQGARRQNRLNGKQRRDEDRSQTAEAKVAKFLTIVSLTLLFLHSPSHVIRLKLLIASTIGSFHMTDADPALQRAFEVMYYLNFSANLAIFALAGENFRRTLSATVNCWRCSCSWRRTLSLLRVSGRRFCLRSDPSAVNLELSLVYTTYENISYEKDGSEVSHRHGLMVVSSRNDLASSTSSISIV
uniref:G-protein coupled receptors family 1 profile domain-containing protein n=1 Tax=Biomphalaria glabrata TaxID=6526 RepID=A0A2C9KXJ9_BIOGL